MDPENNKQNGVVDRLKELYPAVNEEKTPLPRAWSAKEKYNYIGLSQNNLRVHYKGKFVSRFSFNVKNGLTRFIFLFFIITVYQTFHLPCFLSIYLCENKCHRPKSEKD